MPTRAAPKSGRPRGRPPVRSESKRQAILAAARTEFLSNGYAGTSMDAIAAAAPVSKQTVYAHFADKDRLFSELVLSTMEGLQQRLEAAWRAADPGADLEQRLVRLARGLVDSILDPEVLAVRRLIVAESHRFPELGRTYYERGFRRGLQALAAQLAELAEPGQLAIEDAATAADQFAGMVLWHPANQAMFCGRAYAATEEERRHFAEAGARTFLAAYSEH